MYKRRFWIAAALLLFCLELALFVWPVGWLREEIVHYLSGEGSWELESDRKDVEYCQEFVPEYRHIKEIGVVAATQDTVLGGGEGAMSFAVADGGRNVLFHTKIPYSELALDRYEKIEVNLSLSPGKPYYLILRFTEDEAGMVPSLKVCGKEYYIPENRSLTWTETSENIQLLTWYAYEDAIPFSKVLKGLLLAFATAAVLAAGMPGNKTFRRILGVVLLLAGPYILGRRLEMLTVNPDFYLPFSSAWNIGLMYLLEIILLLCTQSFGASVCLSNLFLTVVYTANYYVFSFRGEPLRMNELSAIKTAAAVADHYDLSPNTHLAMAWELALFFIVCGLELGLSGMLEKKTAVRNKKKIWFKISGLAAGIGSLLFSGYVLLYTDFLDHFGFLDTRGFDQNMNYHFDGYLVATMLDIRASRIKKPQGYSIKTVEELFQKAEAEPILTDEGIRPHIILIMNESFSDLRVLGNLQLSQENMPFFNSLKENTVRGFVNASVLGGGTANSEFEVFTGSSLGFLPKGYYAYQQCMIRPIPSLISDLEEIGYTTYSIHPQPAANWNRDRVYKLFGFDYCFWEEDFGTVEKIHGWPSDLETYKKVEELFERRGEEERLFIFDLTMQNHGDYKDDSVEKTVTVLNNSASEEANVYLSLIRESDRAFEQLIAYFERQEEPVVICMYGDHQPKIEDERFYEEIFQQTESLTDKDKVWNRYKTPFIIWANYDISEQEGLDIGMGYLGAVLLDAAGLPGSPYFEFLRQFMEQYPVITVNGYEDSARNYHSWEGDGSDLPEYRILQYNHLFDKDIVSWGF